MSNAGSSGAAIAQQQFFSDAVQALEEHRKHFAADATRRRLVAYSLKAIAAIGGILVAAHIRLIPASWLGIAISMAVVIDGIFSNQILLRASVAAKQASDRLLARIKAEHSLCIPSIVALNSSGETVKAADELFKLESKLTKDLHSGTEKILDGKRAADLKALDRLNPTHHGAN